MKNMEERGYAVYAVMQVASTLVADDLARLVKAVGELVGETNFEFSVFLEGEGGESEGSSLKGKGKRD